MDWLMIIAILAIGIFLILFLRGNSNQCIANPLVYGAQSLQKANPGALVSGQITLAKGPSLEIINFDAYNMTLQTKPSSSSGSFFVNLSFAK